MPKQEVNKKNKGKGLATGGTVPTPDKSKDNECLLQPLSDDPTP